MSKKNTDHLRELIERNSDDIQEADRDEIFEFIEAIEADIDDIKDKLKQSEEENRDLESVNESMRNSDDYLVESINCGIGTIEWESDNIQLQLLMEALAERIQQDGALNVLRALQKLPTT